MHSDLLASCKYASHIFHYQELQYILTSKCIDCKISPNSQHNVWDAVDLFIFSFALSLPGLQHMLCSKVGGDEDEGPAGETVS